MSDQWEFYLCRLEDHPASVVVDVGAAVSAPDQQRPHLVCLRIPLLEPRPADGLAEGPELGELDRLELCLSEAIGRHCDARPVGRLTWNGRRELFYYAATVEPLPAALRAVAGEAGRHELQARTERDAGWDHYRAFLYPSPADWLFIRNRRLCEALASRGDRLHVPRPIEHSFAVGPGPERQALLAAVEADFGLTAVPGGATADEVRVVRSDPPELAPMHALTGALSLAAEAHGGTYRGWSSPLVTSGGGQG